MRDKFLCNETPSTDFRARRKRYKNSYQQSNEIRLPTVHSHKLCHYAFAIRTMYKERIQIRRDVSLFLLVFKGAGLKLKGWTRDAAVEIKFLSFKNTGEVYKRLFGTLNSR